MAATQATLPSELRRLHRAILGHFLERGGPPNRPWLQENVGQLGCDPHAVWADLAAADLVHLDDAGQVRVAYPFSGVQPDHRVQLAGGPPVWAMCTIDALGIPQMTGRDGVVTATDPHSRELVGVEVTALHWRWNPSATLVLVTHSSATEPPHCVAARTSTSSPTRTTPVPTWPPGPS